MCLVYTLDRLVKGPFPEFTVLKVLLLLHTHIFPRGVVHRVEIGWGLTKVAVVLLNGLIR